MGVVVIHRLLDFWPFLILIAFPGRVILQMGDFERVQAYRLTCHAVIRKISLAQKHIIRVFDIRKIVRFFCAKGVVGCPFSEFFLTGSDVEQISQVHAVRVIRDRHVWGNIFCLEF
jgi:hypothetical protein